MFEAFGVVNIWTFLIGTVVIILAPGPNSLYVLATGMRRGVRCGYLAACGVFLGDAALMFLAAVGVDSLLRLYPLAFSVMRYAGAAYLTFLGAKIFYAEFFSSRTRQEGSDPPGQESPFVQALLLSLSNPKAILFFVSFFVQFVDPTYARTGLSFLILGSIVQLTSFCYLSLLIVGGARLAALFRGRRGLARLSRAGVGVVFLGFAFRLALQAR